MLNTRFQSVRLNNETDYKKWIGPLHLKPRTNMLRLKVGSTFKLTDERHWERTFEVKKIDEDGVLLYYYDDARHVFRRGHVKLRWK
jgi:biotin-(acetyl-CoA carboxylase) ligase